MSDDFDMEVVKVGEEEISASRSENQETDSSGSGSVSGRAAASGTFQKSEVSSALDETSVGDAPGEWDRIRLGDIALDTRYGASEAAEDFDPEKPRYIRIKDIDEAGRLKSEKTASLSWDKAEGYLLEEGDILFARSGSVGRTYLYDEADGECCHGGYTINYSLPSDGINHRYLHQYTKSPLYWRWIERVAKTGAQSNINAGEYGSLLIPFPPLDEQRKIASVLYTVDQAIQKTEAIIEQTKRMKQGLLQDLLKGKFSDVPREEKRLGARSVSLPENWKVMTVGEALKKEILVDHQDGNHGGNYPRRNEFVDNGVPYLSAEMLSNGQVDFECARYLTRKRAEQLRVGFAQDGDVLLAHNATVGPIGFLQTEYDYVIIGTSLTYYRCNSELLDERYLSCFLQSSKFQNQLKDVMRQSTRNQVPITRQRNLSIILPPLDAQKDIANVVGHVDREVGTHISTKLSLQRLKKGLMQDLLTGEVLTADKAIDVLDEVAAHG